MAKKRERTFLTELKNSFARNGSFFHKISDLPHFQGMATRFDLSKPFDAFVVHRGKPVAIEAKLITDYAAFGVRHLRDCQVKGLDDFKRAGGEAYVFLNVRRRGDTEKRVRRINKLYIFEWEWLKRYDAENGTIRKANLKAADFDREWVHVIDGANGLFNLSGYFP